MSNETGENGAGPSAESDQLNRLDQQILEFEGRLWKKTALKERAIAQELELTPIQYYQRLAALIRDDRALKYAPATVRKLRDVRLTRAAKRLV